MTTTPTERAIIAADAVAHVIFGITNCGRETGRFILEQYMADAEGDYMAFGRHLFASLQEIQQEYQEETK